MQQMEDYALIRAGIAGQGAIVQQIIAGLTPEQWYSPSQLEGWDVFTLVAHLGRGTTTLVQYAGQRSDQPPERDRISYYNFEGKLIAEGVSQRAKDTAAKTSPEKLVLEFEQNLKAALAVLDSIAPEVVISSAFGSIRLGEYAATRIMELGIHTLDVQASLGLPLQLDGSAQTIIVQILEQLLEQPRPTTLTDDLAFIEAASGRIAVAGVRIPAFSS